MAEVIGEEEIGDDDVFSVEEPKIEAAHLLLNEEAKEKNDKYLFIKVPFRLCVTLSRRFFSTRIVIIIAIIMTIMIILKTSVRLCRSLSPSPSPQYLNQK